METKKEVSVCFLSGLWCTGYPANYSEPRFFRSYQGKDKRIQIASRYAIINGVFRILLSVAFPILTILLIFEIRKSAKFASKALNSRISEERLRTCRMILVMSIFYIISSAPAGMSQFVTIFFTLEYQSIQATLFVYGVHFISALVCLNASLHGIINFTMSSKYRQTAKKCLGMEKQQRGSIASITTT
ncbi:unnamed protein product [Caenorhabditis nigoni]